jgi:hypothetical protein
LHFFQVGYDLSSSLHCIRIYISSNFPKTIPVFISVCPFFSPFYAVILISHFNLDYSTAFQYITNNIAMLLAKWFCCFPWVFDWFLCHVLLPENRHSTFISSLFPISRNGHNYVLIVWTSSLPIFCTGLVAWHCQCYCFIHMGFFKARHFFSKWTRPLYSCQYTWNNLPWLLLDISVKTVMAPSWFLPLVCSFFFALICRMWLLKQDALYAIWIYTQSLQNKGFYLFIILFVCFRSFSPLSSSIFYCCMHFSLLFQMLFSCVFVYMDRYACENISICRIFLCI